VIRRGIELGFSVKVITPQSFDRDWVVSSDFIIFNNFYCFDTSLFHFLLKVVWEYNKPYVIYSHDHRDIIGEDTARPRFARVWFNRSFLNVFISPMHRNNFLEHLGEVINPVFILTPPIDTDFFYPRDVPRRLNSVVNLTGRLVSSKGMLNVYKWAVANPSFAIDVYTKYADGTSGKLLSARPNISIHGPIPYKMLPRIYSESSHVIHLPVALEAAGRTLIEGALCGCGVIMNDRVGVASFKDEDLPIGSRNILRRVIREGPYRFWRAVADYFGRLNRHQPRMYW